MKPKDWSLIVGPFTSQRFGPTIYINPLGKESQINSYNTLFSELGENPLRMNEIRSNITFPKVEEIIQKLKEKLMATSPSINSIVLVGNGEISLYPHIKDLIPQIIHLRNSLNLKFSIKSQTNGSILYAEKLTKSFKLLDEVILHINSGNEMMLKKIHRPLVRTSIEKIIAGTRDLGNLSIMTNFFSETINQQHIDNTHEEHLEDWIETIKLTNPHKIYLYSKIYKDKVTPSSSLSEDQLYFIENNLRKRFSIPIKVFT